jgi:glutamine synthetase
MARLKKAKVRSVQLLFVDPLGRSKGQIVTMNELPTVLNRGQGFDGSSIEGFVRIEESDKLLKPDLTSFRILPYNPGGAITAVTFCDIYNPDGSPFEGCSRFALRRALKRAATKGYDHFYCGPEIEYFYFRPNGIPPKPIDAADYFDLTMTHEGDTARQEVVDTLEAMGILVEGHHHEVAPSQQEIDLKYADALQMADASMLYRKVVKELAVRHNLWACFMPKPLMGENGSGMHVHQSLFKGNRNAFFDPKQKTRMFLSLTGQAYVAGILKYIRQYQLLLNQWINSYKRIVPGFEAPVYICWGQKNRSTLVRVPEYQPGHERATRIEVRNADPGCNPYLAFAAMLHMGLNGIDEKLKLGSPVEMDVYHLSDTERQGLGILSLHGTLRGALDDFTQKSSAEVVGQHIFDRLLDSKWEEIRQFNRAVHPWEFDQYASFL